MFLGCVLALSLPGSSASAQGVGTSRGLASNTDGTNAVQGKVYGPNGQPVGAKLRVRLESVNASTQFASTDSDGTFNFNSVSNGTFRITVEGGEAYENVVDTQTIFPQDSPSGRTLRLDYFLKPKLALDPAFASVPKDALDLYRKGVAASQKGESKKAVELFENAVKVYPKFGPALSEIGGQYLKLGDPVKAAEALESAVKLTPDDFHTRLNFGIALLQQKKFPQAEEQLLAATQKNPASPTAHMYLGIALMSQQKLEEAEKELRASLASNSAEVAPAHKYLGGIYWGQRDYKRAVEELETYLKLMPKAPDAERTRAGIKELKSKM